MSARRSLIASISLVMLLVAPGSALAGDTTVPDTTAPSITLTTPPDLAFYELNETVLASYSCADFESGIASCVGEVPNGSAIDTSSLGQHLFTVSAVDNEGNPASRTHMYTVVAAAEGKPDARIRRIGRKNLVGNNIYSPSAAGQVLGSSLKTPGIRRFVISIQNDGSEPDSYTLSANGTLVTGFDINFYHGWPATNITSDMASGIYQTPTIQPGKVFRLRAVVRIGSAPSLPGDSRLITARSNNDISISDAVRFNVGSPILGCFTAC